MCVLIVVGATLRCSAICSLDWPAWIRLSTCHSRRVSGEWRLQAREWVARVATLGDLYVWGREPYFLGPLEPLEVVHQERDVGHHERGEERAVLAEVTVRRDVGQGRQEGGRRCVHGRGEKAYLI